MRISKKGLSELRRTSHSMAPSPMLVMSTVLTGGNGIVELLLKPHTARRGQKCTLHSQRIRILSSTMARPKLFRDPIHGQIRYEDVDLKQPLPSTARQSERISWLLRRLIDTREFQRLRFIRQNGLANLVFHGAEHSRFSHSMGTAFLAREMHDRIVRNMGEPPDSNGN